MEHLDDNRHDDDHDRQAPPSEVGLGDDDSAPDAEELSGLGPVIPEGSFEPELPESEGEPIEGVQPGKASDVPWPENQEVE